MKTDVLNQLNEARAAKKAAVLITNIADGRQSLSIDSAYSGELSATPGIQDAIASVRSSDSSKLLEVEGQRLFFQVFNPAKRLIIIGAVHISQPLIPMARLAGFGTYLIDPRQAWATPERFPDIDIDTRWPDEALEALAPDARTAVVALTHDIKLDDPALSVALKSDAFYIGALGGQNSARKRRDRLSELGFGAADFARIHGPVGLDIGAISPAEIAISIMGEITQVLHQPRIKQAA